MKQCPFCAEEIQDAAIKCRYCGEFLDGARRPAPADEKLPWHFRVSTIVIAVCCVGPLALPLIWWRPRTSPAWKIVLTVLILALTLLVYIQTRSALRQIMEYYRLMGAW